MLSVTSMMRSAGAVGGALVLLASGASAAVAAPAVFSTTVPALVKPSTLTLSWGTGHPGQTRTCVPTSTPITAQISNTAGQGALNNMNFQQGSLQCTDGLGYSFQTVISQSGPALANVTAGAYSLASPRLVVRDNTIGLGIDTTPVSFSVPYTNGTTGINGANPSSFTFSNTLVAYVRDNLYGSGPPGTNYPLRLTGTLKLGGAAPLTLS